MTSRFSADAIANVQEELKRATHSGYLDNLHVEVNWIIDQLKAECETYKAIGQQFSRDIDLLRVNKLAGLKE